MDHQRITPAAIALLWRLTGAALLGGFALGGRGGEIGLVLVLSLCVLGIARWRFPRMGAWTLLLDQAVSAAALFFWPGAAFGFSQPLFDAAAAGAPWLFIPALVVVTARGLWSFPLAAALAAAGISGLALFSWSRQLDAARHDADRDRRDRYDLESLRAGLLEANLSSARMAEIAERARIARDLHDHAGHELTAAHLALQAYGRLREDGDPQAAEMLMEAQARVDRGLELLRTTVHGLAPQGAAGLDSLEEICRKFTARRAELAVHGNTERIPVHVWSVLEPCIKEGLANAARHSGAERIDVRLDVGTSIARLSVYNECLVRKDRGEGASALIPGAGLRNIRQRARAIGGSVSVDDSDGFRLVCVLPLDDGASADAAAGAVP
jgi:two-component system, NarL family, sensor histidine kinase DesK